MNKNIAPKNSNDKRTIIHQNVLPAAKSPPRENIFSQSRDLREDRGMRQLKTNGSAKAFPPPRRGVAPPARPADGSNSKRQPSVMTPKHNPVSAPHLNPQLVPVHFTFDHPTATTVCVAGSFNAWHPTTKSMHAIGSGRWGKEAFLPPGEYEYCLVVDGQWMPDPLALKTVPNPFGGKNSVLNVAPAAGAARRATAMELPLKSPNKTKTQKS